MTGTTPVLARDDWATNGALIADVARLGYLRPEWTTLDATHGHGTFWTHWQPHTLLGVDLDPAKSMMGTSVDFTNLKYDDRSFDVVVFDPPYKLNGTPDDTIDRRYGVHETTTWKQRMALIRAGARECARVADKNLIVKVQDQVVCSKIRWQTIAVRDEVVPAGFELRARFDFPSYRPQPGGRAQKNPASVSSQLLVFTRGWTWTDLDDQDGDA